MKRVAALCVICLYSIGFVKAQGYLNRWRDNRGDWYIGFSTSTSRYCGDLSERYNYQHLQLSWGVGTNVQYRIDEYLSLRLDVGLVHLRGDGQFTKNKANNLSFTSINPYSSIGLQVDFRSVDKQQYNIPYVWLGFGVVRLDPTAIYSGQQISLAELQTEGIAYSHWAGQIAYGVGVPCRVSKTVQIRPEAHYTHVLSDHLDDVSTTYSPEPNSSILARQLSDRSPEIGLPAHLIGAQRGNSDNNDGYFLLSLQVIYKW